LPPTTFARRNDPSAVVSSRRTFQRDGEDESVKGTASRETETTKRPRENHRGGSDRNSGR
jgi:hypothetical protein